MPRVVSHVEVEAVPEGGTLRIDSDTIVTPLARERASARGVQLELGATQSTAELVRSITQQVVARLPQEPPQVIEAVVGEILSGLGNASAPTSDVCAACIENERARARERAVLTVTGINRRGIAAIVTATLAELGADILDISQTLVSDFFTMIVVFDTRTLELPFDEARSRIEARLAEVGMKATTMHEDVLSSLHRV